MNTLAPSFLIGSSSFLQVTITDMHKLDEFEFRRDPTTDYGVSCPWASEKSMYFVVNTLAPSFLIESSLFMQVRRTTILSRLSSKFSTIRPDTAS